MRQPHTFNAVLMPAGFGAKTRVLGAFQTVGGKSFEKHGDFKPV